MTESAYSPEEMAALAAGVAALRPDSPPLLTAADIAVAVNGATGRLMDEKRIDGLLRALELRPAVESVNRRPAKWKRRGLKISLAKQDGKLRRALSLAGAAQQYQQERTAERRDKAAAAGLAAPGGKGRVKPPALDAPPSERRPCPLCLNPLSAAHTRGAALEQDDDGRWCHAQCLGRKRLADGQAAAQRRMLGDGRRVERPAAREKPEPVAVAPPPDIRPAPPLYEGVRQVWVGVAPPAADDLSRIHTRRELADDDGRGEPPPAVLPENPRGGRLAAVWEWIKAALWY